MDFWTKRQAGVWTLWTLGLNVRQAYGLLDIPAGRALHKISLVGLQAKDVLP